MNHCVDGAAGVREANAIVMTVLAWWDELTPAQWGRLVRRYHNLGPELRVHAWSQMTSQGIESFEMCRIVHRRFVRGVYEVFSYPMGDDND